jgi:hypothetical protein
MLIALITFFQKKVMVKEFRNRSGVYQMVPRGLGSQISWHSAHEGGEVASLTHRPPLPPGNVPGTYFRSRPQGHGTVGRNMSLKNPVTSPGIDPETVRLVAQRLNHYTNPGPNNIVLHCWNVKETFKRCIPKYYFVVRIWITLSSAA